MSGYVLWYKVDISGAVPGLPLTVSNDSQSSSLVVDADITVTMTEGAAADTFDVCLIGLPRDVTDLVQNAHAETALDVTIHLGYFGDVTSRSDAGRVLVGRVMSVTGGVGEDGRTRAVLCGQEVGGYQLRTTPAELVSAAEDTVFDVAGRLAAAAGVTLAEHSSIDGGLGGFTIRSGSVLDALAALAVRADVPMVVRDRKVYLGRAVGAFSDPAPEVFDEAVNVVSARSSTAEDTGPRAAFAKRERPPVRTTVDATVLGQPRLRVGQVATTKGLPAVASGPLRLARVVHRFQMGAGYTTQVRMIAAEPGQRAQVGTGEQDMVDRWRDTVDRSREDHPAVDFGDVNAYFEQRHVASLDYGEKPVELHEKPIASAFAFHKTGLVTPVYARMRAVVAHHRGQVDDAVVAGFTWPDGQQRPRGKAGDYWLALPTELGDDKLPQGKGVNDLIDATGHRVIQVAALHVLAGKDKLPEVGIRPQPPAAESITIEHHSGTTITVDPEGAVSISTSGKPITLTNGSVHMKLDGPSVAVT